MTPWRPLGCYSPQAMGTTCDSIHSDFQGQHEKRYLFSTQIHDSILTLAVGIASRSFRRKGHLDWHFELPSTEMRFERDQIRPFWCPRRCSCWWRWRNVFRGWRMRCLFQGRKIASIRRLCRVKEDKWKRETEWCMARTSIIIDITKVTSSTSQPPIEIPLIGWDPYGKGWDSLGTLGFACVESSQLLFNPYNW